ncbi:uncharacterized protein LOC62_01G001393 [Vanrija pseudolonga]|uniref:Uncharacterized protein n=1 Tax=Vanrija pseudolonga TaxID=143232 RepID=A0AAF0Y534_9TREE|nr:hypothetical protein LOC62_01G001393 [Vanrija pseudolonga]
MTADKVDPAPKDTDHELKLVTVTDGYYPFTEVAFRWPESFGWGSNEHTEIKEIVNGLSQSGHFLSSAGQLHPDFYICEFADGTKKACFSLKQVQFIQYHVSVALSRKIRSLGHTQESKASKEDIPEPRVSPKDISLLQIPLPQKFIPASFVTSVKVQPYNTKNLGRSLDNAIRKQNKQTLMANVMGPLPSVDSTTPSSSASTLEHGDSTPSPSSPTLASATFPLPTLTPEADDSSSALQVEDDSLVTDTATDDDAETDDEGIASARRSATTYFMNARNAYFTASSGGVHRALATLGQAEESDLSRLEERNPSVGRGLFIASDMTLDSKGNYLQAGYSACLWTDPPAPKDSSANVDADMPEMKGDVRRRHWRVTSTGKADVAYFNGTTTIPIRSAELASAMNRDLGRLWVESGTGAVYVIVYSPDRRHHGIPGVDVDAFDNGGSQHVTAAGKGKRYLIDLAKLVNCVDKGDGREASDRSLEEVLAILLPNVPFDANDNNSGNYADSSTSVTALMKLARSSTIAAITT